MRLDASMSYTYPQFPDALAALARESPEAVVIYAVRHPVRRLVSHFHLHRDYFMNDPAPTLGAALTGSGAYAGVYTGASDYALWLSRMSEVIEPRRLVVVPFPVTTGGRDELADVLCRATGLAPAPLSDGGGTAMEHRNHVVAFRNRGVLLGRRLVRRAGLYPLVRRSLGPDRLRRLRSLSTKAVATESFDEALATCSAEQLDMLRTLYDGARKAARDALVAQDARTGLDWAAAWDSECPERTVGADW